MRLLLDSLESESLLDGPSTEVLQSTSSAHTVSECMDSTGDAGEVRNPLVSMYCGVLGGGVCNTDNTHSLVGSLGKCWSPFRHVCQLESTIR